MKKPALRLRRIAFLAAACAALLPAGADAAVHTYTVSNTFDSGPGSLRWAIETADAASKSGPAADQYVVNFSIGVVSGFIYTIRPFTNLPIVEGRVTVDATTQAGYTGTPLIELDGMYMDNDTGFRVTDGELTVKGLIINRFVYGIRADGGGSLTVKGCHIGVNFDGTEAGGGNQTGIRCSMVSQVRIGGTGTTEGNVISNNRIGIDLYTNWAQNLVHDIQVMNNRIGTTRNAQSALPNAENGIVVNFGDRYTHTGGVVIGGPGAARNIISGNDGSGIWIKDGAALTTLRNNIIGLAGDGTTPLPNGGEGIACWETPAEIGGPNQSDGNVISGNGRYGLDLGRDYDSDRPAIRLRNNLIGTDASGTAARPNTSGGISVRQYAVIGGAGAGNVISGNTGHGITAQAENGYFGVAELYGNYIGVTRTGAPLGNTGCGVRVHNGGVTAGQAPYLSNGNLIGANGSHGIFVTGGSWLRASGNYIGTTATGADIGNGGDGIQHGPYIGPEYQPGSVIGGTAAGAGNSIAFNNGAGVKLPEPLSLGVNYLSILGNSIWSNGGLGIDIGASGVLANDPGDTDNGASHRQNYPVITTATPTKVLGTLNSTPNTRFRIEVFRAEPDGTGYGEGRYYLGAGETVTDGVGMATFGIAGLSLSAGQAVTATASVIGPDPDPEVTSTFIQDTSEFSLNRTVGAETSATTVAFAASTIQVSESNPTALFTVVRSGVTTGTTTVPYYVSTITAAIVQDFTGGNGVLTFNPGQTVLTVSVPIVNDNVDENNETFSLHLGTPSGAVAISPAAAVATIVDNDTWSASVPPALSVVEGHTGTSILQVPITLSCPVDRQVTAYYEVSSVFNGATAGTDYDAPGYWMEEVVFAPGETVKYVDIQIHGDTTVEPDEGFYLSVRNGPLDSVVKCLVTIVNDDDASAGVVQFSQANYSVNEGAGSATITVSRTGGTGGAATVSYALVGGTATAGTDFNAATASGVLNFAHGQSSAGFTIPVTDDNSVEGPETLQFQFMNVTGAAPGTPAAATLTITDNDFAASIYGRAVLPDGTPLSGITIALTGSQTGTAVTAANGTYSFTGLPSGGTFTITATTQGYTYEPASFTFPALNGSVAEQDFVATPEVLPELTMGTDGEGRIVLSWPAPSTGWTLRTSTTMQPGSWQPVTAVPILRGGMKNVYLNAEQRAFFKLERPAPAGQ